MLTQSDDQQTDERESIAGVVGLPHLCFEPGQPISALNTRIDRGPAGVCIAIAQYSVATTTIATIHHLLIVKVRVTTAVTSDGEEWMAHGFHDRMRVSKREVT